MKLGDSLEFGDWDPFGFAQDRFWNFGVCKTRRLSAISQFRFAAFASAISTAENSATACLDPVSNNLAAALLSHSGAIT